MLPPHGTPPEAGHGTPVRVGRTVGPFAVIESADEVTAVGGRRIRLVRSARRVQMAAALHDRAELLGAVEVLVGGRDADAEPAPDLLGRWL